MRIDEHLSEAIDWAEKRLRTGSEPPWTYYRLMQLKEAAVELLSGIEASTKTENLSQSAEHQGDVLPPEGSIVRIDTARRHRDKQRPVLPT